MKKTTFVLIGAALVIIAVMALVAAGCHGTPSPPPPPAPVKTIEETTAAPERTHSSENTVIDQPLPDTGGVPLRPVFGPTA